jgi:hypothetical protein
MEQRAGSQRHNQEKEQKDSMERAFEGRIEHWKELSEEQSDG